MTFRASAGDRQSAAFVDFLAFQGWRGSIGGIRRLAPRGCGRESAAEGEAQNDVMVSETSACCYSRGIADWKAANAR